MIAIARINSITTLTVVVDGNGEHLHRLRATPGTLSGAIGRAKAKAELEMLYAVWTETAPGWSCGRQDWLGELIDVKAERAADVGQTAAGAWEKVVRKYESSSNV